MVSFSSLLVELLLAQHIYILGRWALHRNKLRLTWHSLNIVAASNMMGRVQPLVYSWPARLKSLLFVLPSRDAWSWTEVSSRFLSIVNHPLVLLVNIARLSSGHSRVATWLVGLREGLEVFARLALLVESPLGSLSLLGCWSTATKCRRSWVH